MANGLPGGMPPTARRMAAMSLLENSAEPRISENPTGTMEGEFFIDATMFPENVRQGQKVELYGTISSIGSKIGFRPNRVEVVGDEQASARGPEPQEVEGNEAVVDRQGPIEPPRPNA